MKKLIAAFSVGALLLASCASFVLIVASGDGDDAWQDPVYEKMTVVPADYNEGSLSYTSSEDGQNVTISYLLDGETVSYTVPNDAVNLFGGYAGSDDLGRSLYRSDDEGVGTAKAEQERYVGLFYFLWIGQHNEPQGGVARNMQQILDGTSPVGYGGTQEFHWFAEPLYGYYSSNDTWVMRKHVELLTNAGVDFLYFDVTNNFAYAAQALNLMQILHEFNEQGYDAPQVVFYTNTSAKARIDQLYTAIYRSKMYADTWFCIDEKPVVVAPSSVTNEVIAGTGTPGKTVSKFFTLKVTQWPNSADDLASNTNNSWPWIDFHWPQRVYYNGAAGIEGAINVSTAQHSGNANFSQSTLNGYKYNRGRSFTSDGTTSSDIQAPSNPFQLAFSQYYNRVSACCSAAAEDPTLSYQGLNFQEQFDYAIASDATYILVTGWNEWVAANQGDASDPNFVDNASIEYSRDTEMMRGGYFDNYYMQLAANIQRIKGAAPTIIRDDRRPINLTRDFDQWDKVPVTYTDPSGDTVDRNARAYSPTGYITATNTSGRNDIVASKVSLSSVNLYFYIETAETVTKYDAVSSWMQIYLDTDRDATTGWYGYDYIVNYQAEGDFVTTVAQYTGEAGAYGFTPMADTISYRVKGNKLMLAVPLSQLGLDNFHDVDIEFKIADSRTIYDEMEDFYCDGDAAPLGRMNYVYTNYTTDDGEGPIPETEPDPETETESMAADTETWIDAPLETESEFVGTTESASVETTLKTDPETALAKDKGCASAVGFGAVALLAASAAAAVLKRKD